MVTAFFCGAILCFFNLWFSAQCLALGGYNNQSYCHFVILLIGSLEEYEQISFSVPASRFSAAAQLFLKYAALKDVKSTGWYISL